MGCSCTTSTPLSIDSLAHEDSFSLHRRSFPPSTTSSWSSHYPSTPSIAYPSLSTTELVKSLLSFSIIPPPPSPLISLNGNWTPVRHKTVRFVPNSFFDDCEVVTVWWRGVSNRRWQRDAPVCDQHRRQFANKVNCRCGRPRSWWHTVGRRNRFGAVASIDTHTHALTLLDGRTLSHRPQSAPNPERFKHNAVKIAPNRTSAGGQTDQVGWNSSTISLMCSG